MDHLRLKMLTLVVLLSATLVRHTGADPRLSCLNDYIFSINCSLDVGSENASEVYWLSISYFERGMWCCMKEVEGRYFCSINITSLMFDYDYVEQLSDLVIYNMSLCSSNVSDTCRLLIEEYEPPKNIKPNPPCCLSLSLNSSYHIFTWRNKDYNHHNALSQNLMYQLNYYSPDQGSNMSSHKLHTGFLSCSLSDENLLPATEYRARVRSRPNGNSYSGEWSDWSSEIHWKTEPAGADVPLTPFVSRLWKELILVCAIALLLLLSFACVKMWRRRAYIPTPAPYFHTLYNDYHGDFKSWVVTGDKASDAPEAEKVLQVDALTKCVEVQEGEPRPQTPQRVEATYGNIPHPGCHSALLGVPYAVSTAAPAGDEPGCWMCSGQALERGAPIYSNEYCTLSAFRQHHRCGGGAEYEN